MVCEAVSHFYRSLSELSEITFDPKAAQLPDVPLEEYRICMFQQWRPGEIAFTVLSLLYGVFLPLHSSFMWHQPTPLYRRLRSFPRYRVFC